MIYISLKINTNLCPIINRNFYILESVKIHFIYKKINALI